MNFLVFSRQMVSLVYLFIYVFTFLLFCKFRSKITYHGLEGLFYVRASNYSLCGFNIFGVRAVSNMDACLLFPQYVPAIIPLMGAVQMQWPVPTSMAGPGSLHICLQWHLHHTPAPSSCLCAANPSPLPGPDV